MISGYPWWIALFVGLGVFVASFVDAIAGGGGIISVPVYLLAGLPTHLALGTNKLSACLGTTASTYRYVKNKCVDMKIAPPTILLALVGSYIGTSLQIRVDEKYLKYMLLIVLPIVAVFLAKKRTLREESEPIEERKKYLIVLIASLVIGTYDGFYGPGTGTFLLLVFCNLAKMDVRTASGNVKLINLASNVGAVVTSALSGKVLFGIGLIAAAFSIVGHYLGAGVTIKNGARLVRPIIFVVLTLLCIKVIGELVI
ncbi:MAG: TSUP family transporter [Clostridia bacterium]|nr:TSUP family transporter [Clostridia bacterium]